MKFFTTHCGFILVLYIDKCIVVDDKFVASAEGMAQYHALLVDADDPPALDSFALGEHMGLLLVLVPDHDQLALRGDRDTGDL